MKAGKKQKARLQVRILDYLRMVSTMNPDIAKGFTKPGSNTK